METHQDTGLMNVICAWCGRLLHRKPCEPSQDGRSSHTICPDCRAKYMPGI